MPSLNHSVFYPDSHPYNHSYGASERLEKADHAKSNPLTRRSSLTDILNFPGPSSTTANHEPTSLPPSPRLEPWDTDPFSRPSTPLFRPSSRILLERCDHGPSSPHEILESPSKYMNRKTDGLCDEHDLGEVEYSWDPAYGKINYDYDAWARMELERWRDTPWESSSSIFRRPSIPDFFAERPATPPSSSDLDAVAEPPRRMQRETGAVEPVVGTTAATTAVSRKGKEVAREPATASTSSMVPRRSKRKHGDEDSAAVAPAVITESPAVEVDSPAFEVDNAPVPPSKKPKMTPEEVEKAMVPPKRFPTKCGCGAKFDQKTVPDIVAHFARHYSAEEKAEQTKLQCRWGKCPTTLTYGELVRHCKVDHIGARWPCPDCEKLFTRPNGVTRHKQSASACARNRERRV